MPIIYFNDYPDFRPNLTPRIIFKLGSFGGTYWRPIFSKITNTEYSEMHLDYPTSWWKGIPEKKFITPWDKYDKHINKYNVRVGSTLEMWESKKWIHKTHPYGWVQWYCDFYNGKRGIDDERQIKRWKNLTGPNGRFRKNLIRLIVKKGAKFNDITVSPKIRQTLQHWGYRLTKKDFNNAQLI
tara:strand:- start:393 stop:941 length:549 start_codon:yes stop_codon:yes gene_type:complete